MNHSTLVVCWAWCTRSYDDEHHPYRDRDGRPIARSCSQSRRSGGPGSRPHRVQQPPSSLRRLHDDLPWLLDLRPARSLVARPGRPHLPGYPGVPFDPYHPGAYTAEELYNDIGEGYHVTLDAAIDRWRRGLATPPRLRDTLATALHDDAMTDALDDLLAGTDPSMTVGVMGGHSVTRDSDDYRLAADLGAALAGTGHLVTTWGGPGAMEATNLGAACPPDLLDESLDRLRKVAGTADVTAWVQAGLDVVSSPGRKARPTALSASRRGSTVTNHPMSLRPASSSTSRMRCAKISSSTVAEAGSFTYLAKRAPSRKSSKLSLVTTTPPAKTR